MTGGHAILDREDWHAILDALDGDDARRDDAYDALHRHAPEPWCQEREP